MAVVVTMSAAYGAGGSIVGPQVADRLRVPFVDRAIPAAVARECGVPLADALAHDERAEHGLGRLLSAAARLPNVTLGGLESWLPDPDVVPEEEFVRRTEQIVQMTARTTGGVILGRAAAFVLADHPGALHVRLTGREQRRIRQAMRVENVDEPTARQLVRENDRARAAYVRHFYRADPDEPGRYHLVLDSTVLPLDTVVDLVVTAAQALAGASERPGGPAGGG
jgi:cytidylate kinase